MIAQTTPLSVALPVATYPHSPSLGTLNATGSSSTVNKSSNKRLSQPITPTSVRPEDFVLVPEQTSADKILSSGSQTSFAQLSREKRQIKEQHRTLSEGIL
jgi:hypothetical protein